jgi:hypothetical protein
MGKVSVGIVVLFSNFVFPGVNVYTFVSLCWLLGDSHAWKSPMVANIFVRYV